MTEIRERQPRLARQHGLALLATALVLLFIATGVTLFAARVGVMDQRISGNQYRSQEAFEAAEAGVEYGIAYVSTHRGELLSRSTGGWFEPSTPEHWQACDDQGDIDGEMNPCLHLDPSGPLHFDRSRFFRHVTWDDTAGTVTGTAIPEANEPALETGAEFESYLMLCKLDFSEAPPPPPTCCTRDRVQDPDDDCYDSADFLVTVVATGTSADGTASRTIRQSVSSFRLLAGEPDSALMAAGTVGGTGTFDVVANPDGGGPGVPLSAWSADDVDLSGGTPRTCQKHEYLQTGTDKSMLEGIVVCEDCDCPSHAYMTYKEGGQYTEGIDISDRDGWDGTDPYELNPDDTTFPDDVFKYLFNVDEDDWQEVKERAQVLDDCTTLDSTASGLYWIEGNCNINTTSHIGTPSKPPLLVVEGDTKIEGGGKIFGIVFAWEDPDNPGSGGDVKLRGGSQFYGAIISDHEIDMGNGNYEMLFDLDVLRNISRNPDFLRIGKVPGSWTDIAD